MRKVLSGLLLTIALLSGGFLSSAAQAEKPAAKPAAASPAAPAAPAGPLSPEDLNQFAWRHIGPWPFSGRITNFAVPKGQSQMYYVLTASGGVWKTADGGIHFEPIFDKYGNMSMGFLAIAPSDANILYLGTGESIHARAAYHGNGMWRSADAGKTWTHIGLERSYFIPKVEVDPRDPNVVYVAAEGKLYDNEPDCERGVYKTTDGGKTWARVLDPQDRGVADLVLDPSQPDALIATSYKVFRRTWTFLDRQAGNFLWKTTDGGATWRKLTAGLPDLAKVKTGRNGLDYYAKNPKIVYLRLDEEANFGLSERDGAGLYSEGGGFGGQGLFRPDNYLNKLKTYRLPAELARVVKFTPPTADTERDLTRKLNELIRDTSFPATIGFDPKTFLPAARRVLAKDDDALESLAEFEKLLKTESDRAALRKKVHDLVVLALFGASEGIEFKDGFKVTDPAKLKVGPDFTSLVTYDAKTVKDERDLAARLAVLADKPDFLTMLKLDPRRVFSAAQKTYKDKKDLLDKFKGTDDLLTSFDEQKGRYQTVNRSILQVLYAGALRFQAPVVKPGVIYRSEDQGETWARMTEYKLTGGSDLVNGTEAGYYGRLNVDPNDDKVLYAPDTNTPKSTDGGKTFKRAGWEGNKKTHVDHRAAWIDPLNSKHILSANDGGVSESWDGGVHWSQKETIAAQQFYDVSVDNAMPYNVMGGTQDNGCWIGPSQTRNPYGVFPADWLYLPTGDGFYALRDWWNPDWIYYESQFGSSSRMNLRTGEVISLARRNTPEENAAGAPVQRYQWNAPIVLSPHNPGIVYVCSQSVHRSLSHGDRDTWVTISPDLSKADPQRIALSRKTNLQYATIFTFAESPKKPGVLWAGTDDGNLQLSLDGGQTWTNITANFYDRAGRPKAGVKGARIPYDRWVKRVLPSAFDVNVCYVASSGYRTHNEDKTYLYVTRDMGKTFEDISGGLNNPVSDIEEDPDNPNVLYLATDYGLLVTIDQGKTWQNISTSAPHVIIKDLAIQKRDRDLVIATYGRGIYIADIGPFKEFKPETFAEAAHLFDLEDVVWYGRFDRRGQTLGEFASADNPPPGSTIYYFLKDKANKVTVTVKGLDGEPINELNGSVAKGIQKVSWNLTKRIPPEKLEGLDREARQRLQRLDPGTFNITLSVDGKEVATKKLVVKPDPLDRAII